MDKRDIKPHMIDELWFHKGCPDGLGSLFCFYVWNRWNVSDNIVLNCKGLVHGEPPPDGKCKNVAIFDFCFGMEEMKKLFDECNALVVFDHHQSQEKVMKSFKNCMYDNEHSGAHLAFRFFFPEMVDVPRFIAHIEDRDLWKWKVEGSKEYSAYVYYSLKNQMEDWYNLFVDHDKRVFRDWNDPIYTEIIETGKKYLICQEELVRNMAKNVSTCMSCGIKCMVSNSSILKSELGGQMLSSYTDCKAAIIWDYDGKKHEYNFSIRTRTNETNAFVFAKKYGGGGHATASGFKIKRMKRNTKVDVVDILSFFDDIANEMEEPKLIITNGSYKSICHMKRDDLI